MIDSYSIVMLNPEEVSFSRDSGGMLHAVIEGELHHEISLYRTFPQSKPFEYISVRTKEDVELGIIINLGLLDSVSEQEAKQELRYRYFVPVVTRIDSIKQEPGLWIIDFKTDRGDVQLLMRNIHEHIQQTGSGSILFTDMEERRCEITDINKLDKESKKELKKVL